MSPIDILIVDDEVEFAATLAERMELRGYSTRVTNCGEDALAAVLIYPPDIVLLDLKMPDLGGLEVLDTIKESNPQIEVIMLTGHGCTISGIEGMEHGAFDYLMKPVDLNMLLDKVNQAFDKKNGENAPTL